MKMFDHLLFTDRLGKLSDKDVDYWRNTLYKTLKVGQEFEVIVPSDEDLDDMQELLRSELEPTRDVRRAGKVGVYEVTRDGSVPHGLEIITVGRRFDWHTFYEMNKKIMESMLRRNIYTSHHTGMHIHMLSGYFDEYSELEKPLPEIIVANFYQLHRIFATELFWMASGGKDRFAITRYSLFRRPPMDYSATKHSISSIRSSLEDMYGKYSMVNLNPLGTRGRDITRFHVEMRHPDTILSPAYATALVSLEVALLQKAIELSQCGIISIQQEEFDRKKLILDRFVNLGTGDRESDSLDLTDEDIDYLKDRSLLLTKWLKGELSSINPVAYEVLTKISQKPACMMRIEGMDWQEIEEEIYGENAVDLDYRSKLLKIIALHEVVECNSVDEWKEQVSNKLDVTIDKTNDLLHFLSREKIMQFDSEIGSMLFRRII